MEILKKNLLSLVVVLLCHGACAGSSSKPERSQWIEFLRAGSRHMRAEIKELSSLDKIDQDAQYIFLDEMEKLRVKIKDKYVRAYCLAMELKAVYAVFGFDKDVFLLDKLFLDKKDRLKKYLNDKNVRYWMETFHSSAHLLLDVSSVGQRTRRDDLIIKGMWREIEEFSWKPVNNDGFRRVLTLAKGEVSSFWVDRKKRSLPTLAASFMKVRNYSIRNSGVGLACGIVMMATFALLQGETDSVQILLSELFSLKNIFQMIELGGLNDGKVAFYQAVHDFLRFVIVKTKVQEGALKAAQISGYFVAAKNAINNHLVFVKDKKKLGGKKVIKRVASELNKIAKEVKDESCSSYLSKNITPIVVLLLEGKGRDAENSSILFDRGDIMQFIRPEYFDDPKAITMSLNEFENVVESGLEKIESMYRREGIRTRTLFRYIREIYEITNRFRRREREASEVAQIIERLNRDFINKFNDDEIKMYMRQKMNGFLKFLFEPWGIEVGRGDEAERRFGEIRGTIWRELSKRKLPDTRVRKKMEVVLERWYELVPGLIFELKLKALRALEKYHDEQDRLEREGQKGKF